MARRRQPRNRRITITYDIVTPESAEEGDVAESGWEDEEGVSMEPDEYDIEEGLTAVEKAVKFLKDAGVEEADSSHGPPRWFTAHGEMDYRSGETKSMDYHLEGFTTDEANEIRRGLWPKRRGW